eukprot:c22408_g1_i2 orf=153-923(+)
MKGGQGGTSKSTVKFRMPTAENLIPIRVDLEMEGQRYKDAFTWNANDPDSEILVFAKRTVKDLNLPSAFTSLIAQSIQSQIAEFRSYEGSEMPTGERVHCLKLDLRVNSTVIRDQFLWDLGNLESDPEEFARGLCRDLELEDPEVGPAIAVAIREQLYELSAQSVASGRETRISKKARRDFGIDFTQSSKIVSAFDLMKRSSMKTSAVRRRIEWDLFEPVVELLTSEEVEALDAREERNAQYGILLQIINSHNRRL